MSIGYALFITVFYVALTAVGGLILTRGAALYLRYDGEHLQEASLIGCLCPAIFMVIAGFVLTGMQFENSELLAFLACVVFTLFIPASMLLWSGLAYMYDKTLRFADYLFNANS